MFLLSLSVTAIPLKNHMPKGGPQRDGTRISTLHVLREKENTGKIAKEETLLLNVVGLPSTSRSRKRSKEQKMGEQPGYWLLFWEWRCISRKRFFKTEAQTKKITFFISHG